MPHKPNLLVILTDQQSHDLLSCAEGPWRKHLQTPHLDRLAAGGTRFTRAYCSDPVCVPSRFSMFTGRMPSAIGMRGNGGQDLHPFTPEQDQTGLGHCLRRAGYRTWYGGKVHWPVQLTPERLGFTTYCRDERERLAVDTAALIHQEARVPGPWSITASLINPHDICYQGIEVFAKENDGTWDWNILQNSRTELDNLHEAQLPPSGIDDPQWIARLCPPLPSNHQTQHDEPSAIAEVINRRPFKRKIRELWGETEWRLHRWAYCRLMERVDKQIGVILDALDASGQANHTLVVFTSDHGDHAGSHRLEHKTFFYDEAARVPWILRLPGRIPAGLVDDTHLIATGLDLMATLCDYAQAELPAHCLGLSPQPLFTAAQASWRDGVYAENVVSRMFVTQQGKYVRYDSGEHAEQFYDLAADPGETRNHLAARPELAAAHAARLTQEQARHAALALGPLSTKQAGE